MLADALARAEAATGAQATLARENGRLLAEARVAATALRDKNVELDSFVHTVSHDLKSPLVSIQGMAGLLEEELGGAIADGPRRHLDRIQANARDMERLLVDLLALAKIGREARAPEAVDLRAVADEVLAELAPTLGGMTVTIGDLPKIRAVPVLIEQVVRNLLTNAVKYIGDVAAPAVDIGAVDRGDRVEIWVRDNGIGIAPAYHQKIFELFQRLNDVEAEGTGVGLAIVKKIVETAGGRIWVESAPGAGSTFRFTWPKA